MTDDDSMGQPTTRKRRITPDQDGAPSQPAADGGGMNAPQGRSAIEIADEAIAQQDAKAKAEVFGRVFDAGKPMWVKLGDLVAPHMPPSPTKILSVGDGPGEPGCYLAERFGCATIVSDFIQPMDEDG